MVCADFRSASRWITHDSASVLASSGDMSSILTEKLRACHFFDARTLFPQVRGLFLARRLVEVLAQQQGAAGVTELGQGLGLDLPDPLPGDAEFLADLLQGPRVPVGKP